MIITIDDISDPRLDDYTNLTDVNLRRRTEPVRGLFMAESTNVITRAVEAGCQPRSFLMSPRWLETMRPVLDAFPEIPAFILDEPVLESLTGFHLHRGALAAMQRPTLPSAVELLAGKKRIAVLEDIVDHTNVGAIFRSAAALGIEAIAVSPACADPLYRRSVRVSMGTVFQVPWTRLERWPDPDLFANLGIRTVALALRDDAIPLDDYAERLRRTPDQAVAWVLGTEGHGLAPRTLSAVDDTVTIPMDHGVDSLNVAAAAAVVFWATRRPTRRRPTLG